MELVIIAALLALGAELPLQMTADGQPALNCPVHGTQTPVETLLDLSLELLPCGCPRADIADYWAEQSLMLKGWLKNDEKLERSLDLPSTVRVQSAQGSQDVDARKPNRLAASGDPLSIESDEGLPRAEGAKKAEPTASNDAATISAFQQRHESASSKPPVRDAGIMLAEGSPSPDLGVLSELPEIGGDANGDLMAVPKGPIDPGILPIKPGQRAPVAPPTADGRSEQQNAPPSGDREDGASTAGSERERVTAQSSDSLPVKQAPELNQWKNVLYFRGIDIAERTIREHRDGRALVQAMPLETWLATLQTLRLHPNPNDHLTYDPALSVTELDEETESVARALIKKYGGGTLNGNGKLPTRPLSIIVETDETADVINAEYLSRPEVIERLGYSQSIALIIGAKHHGKSTVTRSLALSVPRSLPVWGRRTNGGPVIYAASDDEVAATRSQLLEMGWRKGKDPLYFVHIKPETDAKPEDILEDIGNEAIRHKAVMIILDMLFDFVGIKNELSYAETRTNIGRVQRLADVTKCFTVGTHHTPKYLTDAHEAANAALGSQGVSARFSPIILVRKYAETLFTIESTPTRDPRGQALKPARIRKNENGWISMGDEFKEWMKWEIYAQRVLDLFEGSKGLSVSDVSERLNIDRTRAQNTLKQLDSHGDLTREKLGYRYLYYRAQ